MVRFLRSATKHRISRARSRYVVEHYEVVGLAAPPSGAKQERIVFLGADADGVLLEVIALAAADGDVLVIHAMPMREQYRRHYEEARRWQS